MQVAETDHKVRAARWGDGVTVGPEFGDDDLAVERRFVFQSLQKLLMVRHVLRQRAVAIGCDITPFFLQPWSQDFHVVAAASRQDLHHGAIRAHAEKSQGLCRMAVAVARYIARRAVGGRQHGGEVFGHSLARYQAG